MRVVEISTRGPAEECSSRIRVMDAGRCSCVRARLTATQAGFGRRAAVREASRAAVSCPQVRSRPKFVAHANLKINGYKNEWKIA